MKSIYNEFEDSFNIGKTLRKLRIHAGISQSKLCLGLCDRSALVHTENGKSKMPSIYLLNQICRRLSITLDDFFLLASNGAVNQLWLKTNEIDSLIKAREYESAYNFALKYYEEDLHPMDKQYFLFVKASHYYGMEDYETAKALYQEALHITCDKLSDELYMLNEIRILNGLIYCNFRLNKINDEETLKYIEIFNASLFNYPTDKHYRLIIGLTISLSHLYFSLKKYDDTIRVANIGIKLSNKYLCYSYSGNLWLILANTYEAIGDIDKAKEFYEKSQIFFNLFKEKKIQDDALKYESSN